MSKQSRSEHIRRMKKLCKLYGATITLLRHKRHMVFEVSKGEHHRIFTIATSPGCGRADKNSLRSLEKILLGMTP